MFTITTVCKLIDCGKLRNLGCLTHVDKNILLSCKKYFGECSFVGLTDTLASRKHDGTLNQDEIN